MYCPINAERVKLISSAKEVAFGAAGYSFQEQEIKIAYVTENKFKIA